MKEKWKINPHLLRPSKPLLKTTTTTTTTTKNTQFIQAEWLSHWIQCLKVSMICYLYLEIILKPMKMCTIMHNTRSANTNHTSERLTDKYDSVRSKGIQIWNNTWNTIINLNIASKKHCHNEKCIIHYWAKLQYGYIDISKHYLGLLSCDAHCSYLLL